ncbi:MAG: hypothetical protein ACYDHH_31410 [Solirubrobacteraceae bacterium]
MFVATDAERRCRDGSIIAVALAEGSELPCWRWLAVEFVAAERVDVRVRDWSDAAERLVVGDDVGLDGVEGRTKILLDDRCTPRSSSSPR